jgi:hypothetical protein
LSQIANALNLLRSDFGLGNCRQQQRRQNPDDGDDRQQFNQGERRLLLSVLVSHTKIGLFTAQKLTRFSAPGLIKSIAKCFIFGNEEGKTPNKETNQRPHSSFCLRR